MHIDAFGRNAVSRHPLDTLEASSVARTARIQGSHDSPERNGGDGTRATR